MKEYGKKVWIFPDAELPPEGVNVIPGHESIIITNVTDEMTTVTITLVYENRELVSFPVTVGARRVRCLRTSCASDFGDRTPVIGEQYAIMLESSCPIVAQYGRAEAREVAFYMTSGYCE